MGQEASWLVGFDGTWGDKQVAAVARFLRDLRAQLPFGWLAGVRREVDVLPLSAYGCALAGAGGIDAPPCLSTRYLELPGMPLDDLPERDAELADWESAIAQLASRRPRTCGNWTARGLRRGLAGFTHALCAGAAVTRERFWRLPALAQAFADWSPIPTWRVTEDYQRIERVVFACMWDGTGVFERGGLVAEEFARRCAIPLRVAYVLERRARWLGWGGKAILPCAGDAAAGGVTYGDAHELAEDLRPTDLLVVARPANWWRRWTDTGLWRVPLATSSATLLVLPPAGWLVFENLGSS